MKIANFAVLVALTVVAACSKEAGESDQPPENIVADKAPIEAPEAEPLPAPDAPAYVGVWTSEAGACEAAPGAEGTAPMVITIGEFIGDGELCRIGHAEQGAGNGWRLEMICADEDDIEYTDLMDLAVDGDRLRMTRQGQPEAVYTRCQSA